MGNDIDGSEPADVGYQFPAQGVLPLHTGGTETNIGSIMMSSSRHITCNGGVKKAPGMPAPTPWYG